MDDEHLSDANKNVFVNDERRRYCKLLSVQSLPFRHKKVDSRLEWTAIQKCHWNCANDTHMHAAHSVKLKLSNYTCKKSIHLLQKFPCSFLF